MSYKTRVDRVDWKTKNSDPDEQLTREIDEISSRSADLYRTNALAHGIIQCKSTYVIGKGLLASPQIDGEYLGLDQETSSRYNKIIKREWESFSNTTEIDLRGQNTFNELQEIVYKSKLMQGNGITLLSLAPRRSTPWLTKIQPIDPTLLENEDNSPNTVRLCGGIQSTSRGEVSHYHFLLTHSDTGKIDAKWQTWSVVRKYGSSTGLANITHSFRCEQPGMLRGVSELAPVAALLKNLDDYIKSVVDASLLSSQMFMFVKTPDGDGYNIGRGEATGRENTYEVNGITATNLAEGEEVQFNNPTMPQSTFDGFLISILKPIAAAVEIPLEILIKYFTSSYSAARFGTLDFTRTIQRERTQFANSFLLPIYDRFMFELALKDILPMRGYFIDHRVQAAWKKVSFNGQGFGAINPMQEINSELLLVDRGLKTLDEVALSLDGESSWEDRQPQVERERSIAKANLPPVTVDQTILMQPQQGKPNE